MYENIDVDVLALIVFLLIFDVFCGMIGFIICAKKEEQKEKENIAADGYKIEDNGKNIM